MAYNNSNNRSYIRIDRFGNPYQLRTAYQQENKKTGEVFEAYRVSFELGGKLYRFDISPRKSETKNGTPGMWVKCTQVKKNQQASSM